MNKKEFESYKKDFTGKYIIESKELIYLSRSDELPEDLLKFAKKKECKVHCRPSPLEILIADLEKEGMYSRSEKVKYWNQAVKDCTRVIHNIRVEKSSLINYYEFLLEADCVALIWHDRSSKEKLFIFKDDDMLTIRTAPGLLVETETTSFKEEKGGQVIPQSKKQLMIDGEGIILRNF